MAEATLTGLLNTLSGELGNFVFRTTKNGIVVSNKPQRSSAPPTQEQQRATSLLSTIAPQWATITDTQRSAWDNYAAQVFPTDKDGNGSGPSGQAVFFKINWYRTVQGLPILANIPTQPAPSPVTLIKQEVSPDAETLDFSLEHGNSVSGQVVMVEATRPLLTAARKPQPGDYRMVRGLTTDSFSAMQATGAANTYSFTPVRFPVNDQERYGLQVTILNSEGVPSQPFRQILTKSIV